MKMTDRRDTALLPTWSPEDVERALVEMRPIVDRFAESWRKDHDGETVAA